MPLPAGTRLGPYEILGLLGEGGMGVVYKAQDTRLGRIVAVKFLPEELARDRQAVDRFQREARAVSSLSHPNLITLFDVGESEGRPYFVMELLEGQPLHRRIAGKPLPVTEIVELGIQIADALDAAHSRGVVHRDIKPANLFLNTRGQIKILDFGIAKVAADSRRPAAGGEEASTAAMS